MSRIESVKFKKTIRNTLMATPFMLSPFGANATDFTAGIVVEKMDAKQRYSFVAGIIEGLAYARYAKDGKRTEGMKCVYDFLYEKEGATEKIYAAFDRFKDYLPGAVIAAMVEKECGA